MDVDELKSVEALIAPPDVRKGAGGMPTAEVLREAILSGAIVPGTVLRLDDLADFLGVSPTLAREAVRPLEAQGLVDYSAQRGFTVAQMSPDAVEEMFEVRVALESLALRRSVPKLSDESLALAAKYFAAMEAAQRLGDYLEVHRLFHMVLYSAGCSQRFLALVMREFDLTQRYLRLEKTEVDVLDEDQKEHRALLEACRARDADAAVRIVVPHISKTCRTLVTRVLPHPGR